MDKFATRPDQERHDILQEAASRRDLADIIIEKDFWVCWTLKRLFSNLNLAPFLTFKGGTSLSKAYSLIERFSEDKTISLSDAGLLSDVVDHAREIIFERVEKQIEEKAKSIGNGSLSDTFSRSYDFGSVSFSLGNSTVSGNIKGTVKKIDKILAVEAQVEYLFFDQFTDPLSIRENRKNGTSSSDKADPYTEIGGTAYDIVDRWLTKVTGTIDAEK